MNLLKTINLDNLFEEEVKDFEHRDAVRIVIFDSQKKIALMHATINKYYELPGGGVERDETIQEGAIRESREEAGCYVKIVGEVGITKEYIKHKELINETYCFLAEIEGDKGGVKLNQDEIDRGMEVIWVDVIEAINLINTNSKSSLTIRELTFLEEVKKNYL